MLHSARVCAQWQLPTQWVLLGWGGDHPLKCPGTCASCHLLWSPHHPLDEPGLRSLLSPGCTSNSQRRGLQKRRGLEVLKVPLHTLTIQLCPPLAVGAPRRHPLPLPRPPQWGWTCPLGPLFQGRRCRPHVCPHQWVGINVDRVIQAKSGSWETGGQGEEKEERPTPADLS